ncbi:MAG: hypothetical protein L6R37_002030 [Teloschistes peruensis]|nr:MAG: hypothetical protein L6R37_002030 [Teloschistes peruensis]
MPPRSQNKNSGRMTSSQQSNARRRQEAPKNPADYVPPGTKRIDVGPLLETAKPGMDPDAPLTLARVIGVTMATIQTALPTILAWATTMGLIFGNLITFVQFLVTALLTWPEHFSTARPPFFLKRRAIPLVRWLPNITLFFTVNILNNYAFSYNISVPVHIILRSGGSVTSMLVGFIWGKRYTPVQVLSVALITVGIVIAAMADAQSKGKSTSGPSEIDPSFVTGLAILLFAQILSAIMGLYTQLTYTIYGSHWHENLFYSHFLSLPLFIPLFPSLKSQFRSFLHSDPAQLSPALLQLVPSFSAKANDTDQLPPVLLTLSKTTLPIPKDIFFLALNALTQYVCIRGVNVLSATTTALGVTIVLNMRKLVSLLLSIWIFGNELPLGVLLGATVVFGSAGLWAWEGQRSARKERLRKQGKRQ